MTSTDTAPTPRYPAPPVGENPELDKLLLNIFITAIEGGIGYWSEVSAYHWTMPDSDFIEDLAGFYADIEDPEEDMEFPRIDRARIYSGLVEGAFNVKLPGIRHFNAMCGVALFDPANDFIDFDADGADAIIQLGIFGEVVYG